MLILAAPRSQVGDSQNCVEHMPTFTVGPRTPTRWNGLEGGNGNEAEHFTSSGKQGFS